MPSSSVLANAPHSPSVVSLIKRKKQWAVSVAALNYRLHALGLTSDWTYRTLCIHIAQAGYRTAEPESIPHEKSLVLEKVFALLRRDGVTKNTVAKELSISAQEINDLTFGLMLNALRGGAGQNAARSARGRAKLQLVKP
jgi:Zn-dependent peptidase ImmA (M78 family)